MIAQILFRRLAKAAPRTHALMGACGEVAQVAQSVPHPWFSAPSPQPESDAPNTCAWDQVPAHAASQAKPPIVSNWVKTGPQAQATWSQGLASLSRSFSSSVAAASNGGNWAPGHGDKGYHATTILCVRKDGQVVLIGDGQVSQGSTIVKPNAKKVRRIGDSVLVGFAGSAADGMSLVERLETKLEEHPGQLVRAAVELAKQWRQDKALRFLQAELLVADDTTTLTVSGNGDVLEPLGGVMAIGSGGLFAVAAARALIDIPGMDAHSIATKSMQIASEMCVYTNSSFVIESNPVKEGSS